MRTMEVETQQPRDIKTNVTTTNQTLGNISTTNQTLSNNVPATNQTIDTITAANQALAATVATDNQQQQGDPSTDGSLVTSPITSPGLSNLPLTDYYTIAVMADMLDSPSSVVDSKFNAFLISGGSRFSCLPQRAPAPYILVIFLDIKRQFPCPGSANTNETLSLAF